MSGMDGSKVCRFGTSAPPRHGQLRPAAPVFDGVGNPGRAFHVELTSQRAGQYENAPEPPVTGYSPAEGWEYAYHSHGMTTYRTKLVSSANLVGRLGTNGLRLLIRIMDKLPPGARRALRQAHLYGYLVEREGRFYYPGSTSIVCGRTVLAPLLHSGLLEIRGKRCEITAEGRRVVMQLEH